MTTDSEKTWYGRTAAVRSAASTPAEIVRLTRPESAESSSQHEKEWQQRIQDRVLKLLDLSALGKMDDAQAHSQIRTAAQRVMSEEPTPLSAAARLRIATQIEDEILGFGPLEPLLADPTVSDILINGCRSAFVERNGRLEPLPALFRDNAHLLSIIDRIVIRVGRRIDEASPMVDARLPDGSRVNAIIPPLALDGPMLSIRRFTVRKLDTDQLIEFGTITPQMAELLAGIVKARLNVLISGGTGSGKTTLLNVLSGLIPPQERIVTIEDSAELQLQQPHVCRLETRPANIEGRGEVTQRDLVRNALRMRPDRIIVGEVRGGEAFDMLQAMNTGHDGSLTTVHANTPRDALSRIENMVTMVGANMPATTVRTQIASALHVVVQAERLEDGRRRVVSVQEVHGMEGQVITMSEIFSFRRSGVDKSGTILGQFGPTGVVPRFLERLQQRGIPLSRTLFEPGAR